LNSGQLPLDLRFPPGLSLDHYLVGNNKAAIASVTRFLESSEHLLYLSGIEGTGKTHLLAGLCELAELNSKTSIFIPLADAVNLSPEMLAGLENYDLICLDDVQMVKGYSEWQQALFRLFNLSREAGGHLLVSARVGPAALDLELADLKSRLSWGLSYHLKPLGDEDKTRLMKAAANNRGMTLTDEIANYILDRGPRGVAELLDFLERLDKSSLATCRRLTLPFVREQMQQMQEVKPR